MSRRHEALRRLGAPIEKCPQCGARFNASRLPRHWVHCLFDGELVDSNTELIGDNDLCCSEACGTTFAAEQAMKAAEEAKGSLASRLTFTYLPEERCS
jgi:hypothetical protein